MKLHEPVHNFRCPHVEDLRTLFPEDEAAAKSTEAILRAVSDLLDKTSKSSSERGINRCLRTFSGFQLEKSSSTIDWVKHGSWWKRVTALAKRRGGD